MRYYKNDQSLKGYNPEKDILIKWEDSVFDEKFKDWFDNKNYETIFQNDKYTVKENIETSKRIYRERLY